jgi:hypothetical protein
VSGKFDGSEAVHVPAGHGNAGLGPAAPDLDLRVVEVQLREALAARADRLGIDAASISPVGPGAVIARSPSGALLRLDYSAYRPDELSR